MCCSIVICKRNVKRFESWWVFVFLFNFDLVGVSCWHLQYLVCQNESKNKKIRGPPGENKVFHIKDLNFNGQGLSPPEAVSVGSL